MAPKTVLIADDHDMILNAIELLLSDVYNYKVIARSTTILSVKEKMHQYHPDVLILDLNFQKQNVLDDLIEIKKYSASTKILILSSYDAPFLVKEAMQKGADGYLLKDTSKEELIEALDDICIGKKIIGESVHQYVVEKKFSDVQFESYANLSAREQEVAQMLIKGKNEQEIAESLFISKHTVHDHRKSIYRKLNVRSNAELMTHFLSK